MVGGEDYALKVEDKGGIRKVFLVMRAFMIGTIRRLKNF